MDWLTLSEGEYVTEFCIFIFCILGMPVPEEVTLLSSGILVAAQKFKLLHAIIAGVSGVFVSDVIFFVLGRQLGSRIFEYELIRGVITKSRLTKAESYLSTNVGSSCIIGRFTPGFRVVVFIAAGMLNVKPKMFLMVDLLAAVTDVSFWIFVGTRLGLYLDVIKYFEEIKMIVIILGPSLLLLSAVRYHLTRAVNRTQK